MAFSAVTALAFLQLLASTLAAPRPSTSCASSTTVDYVELASTTYIFPDLVAATPVEMSVYSTGSQKDMATELPTILKERDDGSNDDDAVSSPAIITNAVTTYIMPNLVPTSIVDMESYSTGGQPAATDIGIIM